MSHTPKRALIVDDEEEICYSLNKYFNRRIEADTVITFDGDQALELINKNKFDIVFMDIKMPVMNGLEATSEIRKAGFTELPVIALTASAFETDHQKCMDAGMDDFMAKPIKSENIKLMIHKWVQSIANQPLCNQ